MDSFPGAGHGWVRSLGYFDDWVVLAPSRRKLRRAVRTVQQTLKELKVRVHPDKTFIGRVERGFLFLGYEINSAGLIGVVPPTMDRFVERVNRLYEQGASARFIGDYVRRWWWWWWVVSGLKRFSFDDVANPQIRAAPTPNSHNVNLPGSGTTAVCWSVSLIFGRCTHDAVQLG